MEVQTTFINTTTPQETISSCCAMLGIPSDGGPAVALSGVNTKLVAILGEMGEGYAEPLVVHERFSESQMKKVEGINDKFLVEYQEKRLNILKRFDDYFACVRQKIPRETKNIIQDQRNHLSPLTSITLYDLFNARDDLITSSLEKTSSDTHEKEEIQISELKCGVFALNLEDVPQKQHKSKGKKKKEELKAKRAENTKPVPKREKNQRAQKQLKKEDQQAEGEPLSRRQKKYQKAQKKQVKRQARQQKKAGQPQQIVDNESNTTDIIEHAEKIIGEEGEANVEKFISEEADVENSVGEDDDSDSDSGPRSEGEFIDTGDSSEDKNE